MARNLYAEFRRFLHSIDTLLALVAILLWLMQWCQAYTGIDSFSIALTKILNGQSLSIQLIRGDTMLGLVISIVYWVAFGIFIILSFAIVVGVIWNLIDRIRGKEDPETKRLLELLERAIKANKEEKYEQHFKNRL